MDNKESYRQKMQDQLDLWKEELKKLKAQAQSAGAETMKNLPEQMKVLENKIEEGAEKLKELVNANEEAFEALREGMDSAWEALASGFSDAKTKFKWKKE
jgi:DNA-binding ferritin-like protein